MPIDPEDSAADWAARIERQSALTTELSERLRQVQASAESRDGNVIVDVDHAGGLAGLRLTDGAMRLSPGELGQSIVETSRRAQSRLAKDVSTLVSEMFGVGSETSSFVGEAYTAQFPELADEDEERNRR